VTAARSPLGFLDVDGKVIMYAGRYLQL
jgi:hypothetical protein